MVFGKESVFGVNQNVVVVVFDVYGDGVVFGKESVVVFWALVVVVVFGDDSAFGVNLGKVVKLVIEGGLVRRVLQLCHMINLIHSVMVLHVGVVNVVVVVGVLLQS